MQSVLVVDDEEDLVEILRLSLDSNSREIRTASNGNEAWQQVLEKRPDLIVSDIRMPNGDGISLLKNAHRQFDNPPYFIMITGFADLCEEEALDLGAIAIYEKPFVMAELVAKVNHFLNTDTLWAGEDSKDTSYLVNLNFSSIRQAENNRFLQLGRGGMFVSLATGLPEKGEHVRLEVNFADGNLGMIHGSGTVRWVRTEAKEGLSRGIGIEFDCLNPASRSGVLQYLRSHPRSSYIPYF